MECCEKLYEYLHKQSWNINRRECECYRNSLELCNRREKHEKKGKAYRVKLGNF